MKFLFIFLFSSNEIITLKFSTLLLWIQQTSFYQSANRKVHNHLSRIVFTAANEGNQWFSSNFFLYFMAAYIVLLSGWHNDNAQMISQSTFPSLYLWVVRFHQIIKAIRKNKFSLTLLLTFFSKIDVDVFSSLVIDMIANDSSTRNTTAV